MNSQHWWLNLWTVYDAFLRMPTPLARDMYLSNLGSKISITKLTLYEIQTWMGDLLLVTHSYRVPVFRTLTTLSGLPSLLRRWQEMGRPRA